MTTWEGETNHFVLICGVLAQKPVSVRIMFGARNTGISQVHCMLFVVGFWAFVGVLLGENG